MEAKVGSGKAVTGGRSAEKPAGSPAWIVSPVFDLLFIANLSWLLFCMPGLVPLEGPSHVQFWQVYFLTTPHRWITLILVATDPDRRGDRSNLFVGIAVLTALVILGTRLSTGAFTCLALVDYVWNYWHFGAQHGGIFRMYSRKAGGGYPRLETWGLRLFVFYTALRLAGWTTGWMESWPGAPRLLMTTDWVVASLPALLIALELIQWSAARLGKLVYLASVTGLYGGLLYGLQTGNRALVLSLTAGGAVFHAVEYLAIVSHYAWRRRTQGSPARFQSLARNWIVVLGSYIVCWGLFAYLADRRISALHEFWLGLNLWASALHYAYDGMIWKLRRTQTAKVLDVEVSAAPPAASPAAAAPVLGPAMQPNS